MANLEDDGNQPCPDCGARWNAEEVIADRNEEILLLKGLVTSLRQTLELVQSRFVNEDEL